MAIDWGAWEYSGGNGMRVGLEVTWEAVSHTETVATATVKVWTENQFTYSDNQTLTYSGSISGSTSFTNNDGGAQVLRATKTYDYTYSSSSYGSSPGTKTFTASLSGAYNGVTPSKSVTSSIPARPIAAPAAPSGQSATRVSDTSSTVSWTRNATAGEPYETLTVQRSIDGGAWATVSTPAGTSTSYSATTAANEKYRWQVRANNEAGSSAWAVTGYVWTTPSAPTGCSRSGANGANQTVSWTNTAGYAEYQTEVWRSTNGTWALLTTAAAGATSYVDTYPASHASDKFKYKVRHKTSSGAALYSAYSAETTETAGVTLPPVEPVVPNMNPDGVTVDPTLPQSLSWTFTPAFGGDTQTNREVRHRVFGRATWTTTGKVVTSSLSYALPANTYAVGDWVEWQVRTWGSDPSPSPWSESAKFNTALTIFPGYPEKVPVELDLYTGRIEAGAKAHEVLDYVGRSQALLLGGGARTVTSSYVVSWSQRFIPISLGRSADTFPNGHHDILVPDLSWTVTNKALTSNFATLTVSTSDVKMRVGETIVVSGVGAPFDGTRVVRSIETNKFSFDCTNADIASTSATGTVQPRIWGHGGASDTVPSAGGVTLGAWTALYYEMPFGWGAGAQPRKNGVVAVTNKALTSNVVTLTVTGPHYFAVGDRITVSIGDATFDGTDIVVTGVTSSTVKYAKTASNVSSTAATGLAIPSGKDTFFGNFHLVSYTGDFVVPSNWLLIAVRNGDAANVKWGDGEETPVWVTPTLTNSWVAYDAAGTGYSQPRYMRKNGVVHVQGMIKNGSVTGGAFTLPAGFRPAETIIFACTGTVVNETTGAASAGTAHTHPIPMGQVSYRVDVQADGVVRVNMSTGSNGWLSLGNISFLAEQ